MSFVKLIRISKTTPVFANSSDQMNAEDSQNSKTTNPVLSRPLDIGVRPPTPKQETSDKKSTECETIPPTKPSKQTFCLIKKHQGIEIKKVNATNTNVPEPTKTELRADSKEISDSNKADSKENTKTVESSNSDRNSPEPEINSKSHEPTDIHSDSEDSFPSQLVTDDSLTEDSGVRDVVPTTTSNPESKVVVQVLSNAGCGRISALEHCIDVSETPIDIVNERLKRRESFSDEETNFLESNNGHLESSEIVNEDRKRGKLRRKHMMNLHITPGNGVRLGDIPYVASNLEEASSSLLGFLHKVLFGKYGNTKDEEGVMQTKQDILHFSGFPFAEDSEFFKIKRKGLQKVPYQMLNGMCNALLEKSPRTRYDSVEDLLKFLLKPSSKHAVVHHVEADQEYLEYDFSFSEKEALKGSLPVVLVKKLNDDFVDKVLAGLTVDSSVFDKDTMEKVCRKPKYTRVGGPRKCGVQLKSFPEVVNRVQNARRRIINLMHIVLFGRPGSDDVNRLNILEFEGFSDNSESNLTRKREFLLRLKVEELNQMCSLFSLRVKKSTKLEKVMKFLNCLQSAELRKRLSNVQYKKKQELFQRQRVVSKNKVHPSEQKMNSVQHIKKLKDFENIRRNIECAPPEELIELSDLLFLMPCDSLEIHQQILDFSSSSFKENSPEFHSRRTLLYYMSFDIIRKIASLLEITDWEEYTHPQELANTLLRFLMEMIPPVSIHPKAMQSKNGVHRGENSAGIQQPHLMRLQKYDHRNNLNGMCPSSSALPDRTSFESFLEERRQDTSVVVRRITESSYSFTDLKSNESVTVSDGKSEESLPMEHFLQHPSEKQLEVAVREIVSTNPWSCTMGEVLNKVFHCYPKFNLAYRIEFIKSKAIEILHELQFKSQT